MLKDLKDRPLTLVRQLESLALPWLSHGREHLVPNGSLELRVCFDISENLLLCFCSESKSTAQIATRARMGTGMFWPNLLNWSIQLRLVFLLQSLDSLVQNGLYML